MHRDQNALDLQFVVAVLSDYLVMPQQLRQSLRGQELRLRGNNNAVRTHHHINHERPHLRHTVNDHIQISVPDRTDILRQYPFPEIHVTKIPLQREKLGAGRYHFHAALMLYDIAVRLRQWLGLHNFLLVSARFSDKRYT